ncbi:MAG: Mur ligase [Frankiales bacterium]|nr:Mur ligase [Frankiales bacterium]
MPHRPDQHPPALLELRLLDGPNLYFPRAACKVVLDVSAELRIPNAEARARQLARELEARTRQLAATAGTTRLAVRSRPGPEPGQLTVAFPWRRRELARALGVALADPSVTSLEGVEPGEAPSTPRPKIPVVAITGTNGKTTTTRLVAHMSRCAGNVTGWSSTDGVFVDGVMVEEGDWSGYGGAGRVLADKRVQLAVLETARGGLLLRGAGALHNDVSVVTNVAADHLGLQGIHTVDELAEVKGIVPRITREGGWFVCNAQDPRVLAMPSKGRRWAFSLDPDAPGVRTVLQAGGRATTVLDETISVLDGGSVEALVALVDIPMTLSGLSRHDVANALAATSAALAVGLPRDAVIEGLLTFGSEDNLGRMNLWDVGGAVVSLDLAHNEDGLKALLSVVRGLRLPGGRVVTVLGLAGDRLDGQLVEMGHLARHGSDEIVIALKDRYLRGRTPAEMTALLRAGAGDVPAYDDEVTALRAALLGRKPEDVIALMVHQDRVLCEVVLREAGGVRMTPGQVRTRVRAAAALA